MNERSLGRWERGGKTAPGKGCVWGEVSTRDASSAIPLQLALCRQAPRTPYQASPVILTNKLAGSTSKEGLWPSRLQYPGWGVLRVGMKLQEQRSGREVWRMCGCWVPDSESEPQKQRRGQGKRADFFASPSLILYILYSALPPPRSLSYPHLGSALPIFSLFI